MLLMICPLTFALVLQFLFLTHTQLSNIFIDVVDAGYPPVSVTATKNYQSSDPTWVTSPYFRANNQAVINSFTGSGTQPSYTFIFSSALPGIPNLAYGVKGYRGNDYLIVQYWEVTKIGLSASSFSVRCEIFGSTNLWVLNVAYIAIDPTFPHHLNAFDNVPVNYSSGDIVNLTTKVTDRVTYFVQTVNYTQQSNGRKFTQFNDPIQYNNIVLYMTNLWMRSSYNSGGNTYPIKFHITPKILNSSHYQWNATLETNVLITRLQFSQIIYNSHDVQSSKKYYIQFQYWYNDKDGGFIKIPQEFVDNFIMAVTDFETVQGQCGFQYQWVWAEQDGEFGIEMLLSWTINNRCGFSWSRSTIFYMQTWLCEAPYVYFNLTSGLCQTLCGGFTIQNQINSTCDSCDNLNCYQCNPDNPQLCLQCATYMNYHLVGTTCVCLDKHYEAEDYCHTCQTGMLHCLDCSYNDGHNGTLPFDANLYTCLECNETVDYFLDAGTCTQCTLSNCMDCLNLTACLQCNSAYDLSSIATCITCSVEGCLYCEINDENKCQICNQSLGYYAHGDVCEAVCGDGIIVAAHETCDDNNTNNYDGCSSSCVVEVQWQCSGTTSICEFSSDLTLTLINTDVSLITCNLINFTFQITPHSATFGQSFINWDDFVTVQNSTMLVANSSLNKYDSGTIQLVYIILETVQDKIIHFNGNASVLIQNSTAFDNVNVNPIVETIRSDSSKKAIFQCCDGYYFDNVTQSCLEICGDGLLYQLECDDGNVAEGDGCTSDCMIQEDYDCINGTVDTPSVCSFNGSLSITIKQAIKDPHSNHIQMTYQFSPIIPLLSFVQNDVNFTNFISYPENSEITVISAFYDTQTGNVVVELDYDESIQDKPLEIQIKLQANQKGSVFPIVSNSWIVSPTNHLAAEHYDEGTYETVGKLEIVSSAIGTTQTLLFFSTLCFRKFIGLELSFLIQIGYLSMMMNKKNSPLQSPIMDMPFVFGYNKIYLSNPQESSSRLLEQEQSVDTPYRNYGYKRYFGYTYNLMFMIHFGVIVLGILVLFISMCTRKGNSRKLKVGGFELIGEVGFGLLLFSFPNIILGLSIQIQEDSLFDLTLIWSKLFLLLTMIFIVIHLLLTYFNAEESSELSTYFRKHSKFGIRAPLIHACRIMIIVTFLFLYATYPSISTYIILATQLLYVIFVLFGQPHKKTYDTVRSGLIEIFLFYILTMRFIQSAILEDTYQGFTNQFYTAIAITQYVIYGLIIVLSIISFIYHLWKQCCSRKAKINPQKLAKIEKISDQVLSYSHAVLNETSPSKRKPQKENQHMIFDIQETGDGSSGFQNINLDYLPSKRKMKF